MKTATLYKIKSYGYLCRNRNFYITLIYLLNFNELTSMSSSKFCLLSKYSEKAFITCINDFIFFLKNNFILMNEDLYRNRN